MTPDAAETRSSSRRVVAVGFAVAAATLVVHARSLLFPALLLDDFIILRHSLTWADARERLWVPVNEHCWPLFRLLTWAVAWVAGGAASLPLACAASVRVVLLGTVALVYVFVRRERGHAYYGLAAAAVFGVTAVYQEAVYWYAASPAVWSAAATLLALLGAQRWSGARSWFGLVLAGVWSVVAPAWYGGGVLTGPLCALYLLVAGRMVVAVVPVLGTVAYLVVALAMSGNQMLDAMHHDSRDADRALDPVVGAVSTARSVVDNLALGAVGVAGFTCPPVVAAAVFAGVVGGVTWWWRRAPRRDLVVLGLAFVVLHFGLIYTARAVWPYDTVLRGWSRYNLFPWLGVVLALSGGLRRPAGGTEALGGTEARRLLLLVLALTLINLPRGILGTPIRPADQPAVLRRVEDMDRKCRGAGVPSVVACRVLDPLPAPGDEGFDAYLLMWGGSGTTDMPDGEARVRLGLP